MASVLRYELIKINRQLNCFNRSINFFKISRSHKIIITVKAEINNSQLTLGNTNNLIKLKILSSDCYLGPINAPALKCVFASKHYQ